jgi:hypothetical protein
MSIGISTMGHLLGDERAGARGVGALLFPESSGTNRSRR